MKPFGKYTEEEKKIYLQDVHELSALLNSLGFKTHLQFGALLGLIREGKLIDTDTDIDLCFLSNESDPEKVVQEIGELFKVLRHKVKIWRYFNELGKRTYVHLIDRPYGQIFIQTKNKNLIDLGVSWIMDGEYWECKWGKLCKWEGLERRSFYGYEFDIPVNYKGILDSIYGDDWMTPKITKAHHRIKQEPVLYNLTHQK